MTRRIALLVAMLTLSGCATWQQIDNTAYVDTKNQYSLRLPIGWMKPSMGTGGHLWLTKDGFGLQTVRVAAFNQKTAFPQTEQKFSTDLLPQEVAELLIAEIKQSQQRDTMEVLVNEPATIGQSQVDGFHIVYTYRTERGLRYQANVYGFVRDNLSLFTISYSAPVLHYYDRDIETFRNIVNSFRLEDVERKS